jgi:hypothetical protein
MQLLLNSWYYKGFHFFTPYKYLLNPKIYKRPVAKVKILPLIPPYQGKNLKPYPLPLARGGLGRGHSWIFARVIKYR